MDNLQLMRDGYEAFGRGDVGAVLALFEPTIEWRNAEGTPYSPEGKPWVGPDEIVENLFMRLATEWDGFTITPMEFHEAGDTIVVECRYTGVFKETGKRINAQACHVWKLSEGKIKSFQQYVDTAQLQDAMGALLASGARRG